CELGWIARLERESACQHAIQHDSEGVDVACWRRRLSGRLLRGHVCSSAENRPRLRERVRTAELRDPEVGDLRASFGIEQHVGRLQIAMDDAAVVSMRESLGYASGDSFRLGLGQPGSSREAILER